jgi:hypothetical protein
LNTYINYELLKDDEQEHELKNGELLGELDLRQQVERGLQLRDIICIYIYNDSDDKGF